MALISHSVSRNAKRDETDEPSYLEKNELEDADEGKEFETDTLRVKKRKKAQKEQDENLAVEQEREMKPLENVSFGSLYSPVVFGKEDEEEETRDGPASFFMDRSANTVLSVYEDKGAELLEETKLRKPVWVDEEEEKTRINIAKFNRIRKLRKEGTENLISGSQYVSRLRAQRRNLTRELEMIDILMMSYQMKKMGQY